MKYSEKFAALCMGINMLFALMPTMLSAQEDEGQDKVSYKFYGHITHEAIFDTHRSVFTRDGSLYLYPASPAYHPQTGSMINKNSQFEMLSLFSRVGVRVAGPDVFNAKLTGLLEGDFYGTSEMYKRHLRVRHAMMKLQWDKASITLGQYWHPMFTPEVFPKVSSAGAAAPFNPLNRSPQVRFDFTPTPLVKIVAAALAHGYHSSSGPERAQKNAGLPDLQFQLHLGKSSSFLTGITAGYMWLQPLETSVGGVQYYSEKLIGAYNLQWFGLVKLSDLTLQAKFSYGENMSQFVMLGGYGRLLNDASSNTDYDYANLRTYAGWIESFYDISEKWNVGLFAGVTGSLGATQQIDVAGPIWYQRAANLAQALRVSPRIVYTNKHLSFALEYMYSSADYGSSFDVYGAPLNLVGTHNNRMLFRTKYTF